jgi:hypothetical protein
MSREDLSAMLAELADEVQPQPMAARAWATARQVRRRRRAVLGATVAVLLVSATVTLYRSPDRSTSPTNTPSPTASVMARVDRLPATIPAAEDAAPYWPATFDPPADAPPLTTESLSHTVLLFQPNSEGPIYAYGEGSINGGSGSGTFRWVRLDVSLDDTRDEGGNRATPVDLNSLGPGGYSAAFAQVDELVVVDLRVGVANHMPLPGLNEEVSWVPSGQHLFVSSATQTWLTATDRVIGPAVVSAFDVTPLVGNALELTTMTLGPSELDPLVVRRYDDEGRTELSQFTVDVTSAPTYRLSHLAPRGWRMGNLIAQAGGGQIDNHPGDFVIVVDDRTESITHVLDLGSGRNKGCCAVVGWENSESVLVRTGQDGLLRWHLPTGAVSRLTAYAPGAVSVAPMGCSYRVTIEGATYGCMS